MKIDEQWDCCTLCAIKIEGKNRGGEGTTPVTTACPEAGKLKCENNKNKKRRNALDTFRRQTKESVGVCSDLSDRNMMNEARNRIQTKIGSY